MRLYTYIKPFLLNPGTQAIYVPRGYLRVGCPAILAGQFIWGVVIQHWGFGFLRLLPFLCWWFYHL